MDLTEIWKMEQVGSGTNLYQGYTDYRTNYGDGGNAYAGGTIDMNASDYIQLYAYPSTSWNNLLRRQVLMEVILVHIN